MIWFILFFGVSVIVCDNITYNSSDLSYLGKAVQLTVSEFENQTSKHEDLLRDISHFQWLSGLYDHYKWRNNLAAIDIQECRNDMNIYLSELKNGTSWAAKMYDASGRYPSQFLFGNDYWLGSKTLCEELTNNETNKEIPDFQVQFYVAKVRIRIDQNLTPVTRLLQIGECLPKSCDTKGVWSILEQDENMERFLSIVEVRKVPGEYSIVTDFKVYILGGISSIFIVLMVVATLVEFFNRRDAEIKKDLEYHDHNNKCTKEIISERKKKFLTITNYPLKLLHCFSAIHNGRKIMSLKKLSLESIKCIHGLRFISIAWIILVHTYLEVFAVADNKNMRILTERSFMYQTISNASFSVDTFFFISGLLITLTYFRSNGTKKKPSNQANLLDVIWKNCMDFTVMLIYRFCRLTPAYMFVLSINEVIMKYSHSHSVFSPNISDHVTCEKFWWRNALYINNFFPRNEFCMLWSWYMANDSQFYVLASVFLLIGVKSHKHLKTVAAAMVFLLLSSWVTSFVIAMEWDYFARVETPFALFDQLYDKPWLRIGPYFVGMMVGYLLYRVDCKIIIPKYTVIGFWLLSLTCLGFLVYGLGSKGLKIPLSAFYVSLGHTVWALSLAWITVACSSGYGGPLNSLLSSKFFLPLSRLTYCAYLVHPVIMCFTSFHLDGPLHLHNTMAVIIFLGNLVVSFLAAFCISMVFEAPIVNLLKIVLY